MAEFDRFVIHKLHEPLGGPQQLFPDASPSMENIRKNLRSAFSLDDTTADPSFGVCLRAFGRLAQQQALLRADTVPMTVSATNEETNNVAREIQWREQYYNRSFPDKAHIAALRGSFEYMQSRASARVYVIAPEDILEKALVCIQKEAHTPQSSNDPTGLRGSLLGRVEATYVGGWLAVNGPFMFSHKESVFRQMTAILGVKSSTQMVTGVPVPDERTAESDAHFTRRITQAMALAAHA